MKFINRNLLYITPKQALIDWYLQSFPNDPVINDEAHFHDKGNVYLIPEFDDRTKAFEWLKKNCDVWFDMLLAKWCADESLLPAKRNWRMMNDFFEISYQSLVIDTLSKAILREDL